MSVDRNLLDGLEAAVAVAPDNASLRLHLSTRSMPWDASAASRGTAPWRTSSTSSWPRWTALKEIRPSIRPWFDTAKNYAQFANEGGVYDDLLTYLRARRWL